MILPLLYIHYIDICAEKRRPLCRLNTIWKIIFLLTEKRPFYGLTEFNIITKNIETIAMEEEKLSLNVFRGWKDIIITKLHIFKEQTLDDQLWLRNMTTFLLKMHRVGLVKTFFFFFQGKGRIFDFVLCHFLDYLFLNFQRL